MKRELKHSCGLRHSCVGFLLSILLSLTLTGIHVAYAESALKKVTLIPIWKHQAQFAGYYVALEKGIYARNGIDLTILNGGPGRSPHEYLLSGKADFAVLWLTTAMQQYSVGNQLVNMAQIIQKSSMVLVARKESGIRRVSDLQNRKISIWDNDLNLPARAFFSKYRVQTNIIPNVHTPNLFLRGGVDVAFAMWYNEYHTILNSGINPDELDLIFLHDHGITFPEDGLYTLEKNYRKDPLLADAFARASLEGWRYAFDHPEEAVDIVIRYMKKEKIPANRAHQAWMLMRMRDLMLPQKTGDEMGRLSRADYDYVGASLRSFGIIKTIPDYQLFTGKSNAHK